MSAKKTAFMRWMDGELVKYATALGGKLTLRIEPARIGSKATRRTLRRAS